MVIEAYACYHPPPVIAVPYHSRGCGKDRMAYFYGGFSVAYYYGGFSMATCMTLFYHPPPVVAAGAISQPGVW